MMKPFSAMAMNELYELMWVYYNLFQPVLHLNSKQVVNGKLVCKWDEAKTPYESLKHTGVLSQEQVQQLDGVYETTNPKSLRRRIREGIPELWQPGPAQEESRGRNANDAA
ncbi:MAG: hypothetical protein WKH64_12335 [Chloroflexia bacterium]